MDVVGSVDDEGEAIVHDVPAKMVIRMFKSRGLTMRKDAVNAIRAALNGAKKASAALRNRVLQLRDTGKLRGARFEVEAELTGALVAVDETLKVTDSSLSGACAVSESGGV